MHFTVYFVQQIYSHEVTLFISNPEIRNQWLLIVSIR